MTDFAVARAKMVDCQIRTNKVTDAAVVAALRSVPRERFVPPALQSIAYCDEDLRLGPGRYLMEPMVFARLLQEANISPRDRVIDIGGGFGYAAAVLASVAREVVSVESDAALAEVAGVTCKELGYNKVQVVCGPLEAGYPPRAPYDVMFFGGLVEHIPDALVAQVAEGGRVVAVMRGPDGIGRGCRGVRSRGYTAYRPVFDAATAPLPGFARVPSFVF